MPVSLLRSNENIMIYSCDCPCRAQLEVRESNHNSYYMIEYVCSSCDLIGGYTTPNALNVGDGLAELLNHIRGAFMGRRIQTARLYNPQFTSNGLRDVLMQGLQHQEQQQNVLERQQKYEWMLQYMVSMKVQSKELTQSAALKTIPVNNKPLTLPRTVVVEDWEITRED